MENKEYIVVDAGNTLVKIARFQNDELLDVAFFKREDDFELKRMLQRSSDKRSILSSVVSENRKKWIVEQLHPTLVLTNDTKLPISLDHYKTKNSLGTDRIANAVAGHVMAKGKDALVIDIGTCIKFDFVDKTGSYKGGSISPGMQMRFKAMHDYTGKLPLISDPQEPILIGDSTFQSMNTGVVFGIKAEINGFIAHYSNDYKPLTIFLTGGDHKRFDKGLKNSIFAEDYLTLRGLYLILKYNEE
ncbi:MAG: type III pantothenate kinase [Brumimicrobium sp.]